MNRASYFGEIYLEVMRDRAERGAVYHVPVEALAEKLGAETDAYLPRPCGWTAMIKAIEDKLPVAA